MKLLLAGVLASSNLAHPSNAKILPRRMTSTAIESEFGMIFDYSLSTSMSMMQGSIAATASKSSKMSKSSKKGTDYPTSAPTQVLSTIHGYRCL